MRSWDGICYHLHSDGINFFFLNLLREDKR